MEYAWVWPCKVHLAIMCLYRHATQKCSGCPKMGQKKHTMLPPFHNCDHYLFFITEVASFPRPPTRGALYTLLATTLLLVCSEWYRCTMLTQLIHSLALPYLIWSCCRIFHWNPITFHKNPIKWSYMVWELLSGRAGVGVGTHLHFTPVKIGVVGIVPFKNQNNWWNSLFMIYMIY